MEYLVKDHDLYTFVYKGRDFYAIRRKRMFGKGIIWLVQVRIDSRTLEHYSHFDSWQLIQKHFR